MLASAKLTNSTCWYTALAVLVALAIPGPGAAGEAADGAVPRFVPGEVDTFPRVEYSDGRVSLNDRCPVRKVKLNPRMPPVYVNGGPVGFC